MALRDWLTAWFRVILSPCMIYCWLSIIYFNAWTVNPARKYWSSKPLNVNVNLQDMKVKVQHNDRWILKSEISYSDLRCNWALFWFKIRYVQSITFGWALVYQNKQSWLTRRLSCICTNTFIQKHQDTGWVLLSWVIIDTTLPSVPRCIHTSWAQEWRIWYTCAQID